MVEDRAGALRSVLDFGRRMAVEAEGAGDFDRMMQVSVWYQDLEKLRGIRLA